VKIPYKILAVALILSATACAAPEQHTGEAIKTSPPETSIPAPESRPETKEVPEQTIQKPSPANRARKLLRIIFGGVNR